MTFDEFIEEKRIKLTPTQSKIANEFIIPLIDKNEELTKFFSGLGTGTTFLLELIELYYKGMAFKQGRAK